MTTIPDKPLRAGSSVKRAAILAAARSLLLSDGFERTSVDAIAGAAGVSKRTIYDYFGDKQSLLLAVVGETLESVLSTVRVAVDETLRGSILSLDDVNTRLVVFARRVSAGALGSADYAALRRLVAAESAHLPRLSEHWSVSAPEDMLVERFVDFERAGLLRVPKPRLAADHFVALTFSLAKPELSPVTDDRALSDDEYLVEGVAAFLRAYGVHD
jgi:TetR/AcrR family transcriptional repressor of mexJK operon